MIQRSFPVESGFNLCGPLRTWVEVESELLSMPASVRPIQSPAFLPAHCVKVLLHQRTRPSSSVITMPMGEFARMCKLVSGLSVSISKISAVLLMLAIGQGITWPGVSINCFRGVGLLPLGNLTT